MMLADHPSRYITVLKTLPLHSYYVVLTLILFHAREHRCNARCNITRQKWETIYEDANKSKCDVQYV